MGVNLGSSYTEESLTIYKSTANYGTAYEVSM